MSRNQLYSCRLELCLTPAQYKIVKDLAKSGSRRMNEVIREAIVNMQTGNKCNAK